MTKEQIHDEMIRVQMEMQQNKRNPEMYVKLEEEHQRLKREYAQLLVKEMMEPKEETKKSKTPDFSSIDLRTINKSKKASASKPVVKSKNSTKK